MNPSPTVIELHHGDCVTGMRALAAESVDVVVTSPPYNLGIKYSKFDDTASREDYLNWSVRWATEVRRVLKPDGALFLNVGSAPANPLMPHQLAIRLSELFVLQNTLHWIKSITVETRAGELVSAGHFKPINSPRYVTDCHEYVFHLTKSGNVPVDRLAVGVPYVHKSNIARWGHTEGRDKRCRGNNWFVPYETIKSRDAERPHPATFPVALASMCLRAHGAGQESVVLDPFVGIGHAATAARECGVGRFIGFDIDGGYLGEAKARLEDLGDEVLMASVPNEAAELPAAPILVKSADVEPKKRRGRPPKVRPQMVPANWGDAKVEEGLGDPVATPAPIMPEAAEAVKAPEAPKLVIVEQAKRRGRPLKPSNEAGMPELELF
ncbi:MAG: site-specific DNA-methyltransferase [Verrucomicrobiota bacterium]